MSGQKYFLLLLLLSLFICRHACGQTPANDRNWQLNWSDEFSDPLNRQT